MTDSKPAERPAYEVRIAETKDEREACFDLRVEVYIVEQGFSLDDELDKYEEISTHFLLVTKVPSPPEASLSTLISPQQGTAENPIGTIRFTPSIGKIARFVVLKDYRNFGFGRILMQELEDHARRCPRDQVQEILSRDKEGREVIKLEAHSQIYAIPFYAKMGYSKEGEEFDEDGAPHQNMVKYVPWSDGSA